MEVIEKKYKKIKNRLSQKPDIIMVFENGVLVLFCIVDQCWVDQLKSTLSATGQPDWRQTFPLTEDINLWQFSPLAEAHAGIEFTSKRRGQLSDIQEVTDA